MEPGRAMVMVAEMAPGTETVEMVSGAVSENISNVRPLHIVDKDFDANWSDGKWTVKWKWVADEPAIRGDVAHYQLKPDLQTAFEMEGNGRKVFWCQFRKVKLLTVLFH
jgi:hypothetical protein